MKAVFCKLKKSETFKAYVFLLPSLVGTAIFVMLPFIDVFLRSFKEAMSGKFIGINNYRIVIENKAFRLATGNTIKFILICIPLLLIISLLFSVMIMNIKKYREFIKTSFLIPLSIPVASMVFLWKMFFCDKGLINGYMDKFNIESISWLNSNYTFYVLVFTYLWKNCGYNMVLWATGLDNISKHIYEAASIDGCSFLQKIIYITLPNLKTTIFTVITLSLINSFKAFREAYLICGEYPHDSIYMLQHIFNNWFVNLDVQKMCATAILISIVLFAGLIIMQIISNKGDENND